jgi:hypothetical protein
MLNSLERIIIGCLNGGFLSVVIAWHEAAFNKAGAIAGIIQWQVMMIMAGFFWLVAAAVLLWVKRSDILQQEVHGFPPWYFLLLSVPLCIYAFIMPWALLQMLEMIVPITTQ